MPYETYAGLLSRENPVSITTDFFIEKGPSKYKANYVVYIRANDEKKKIEIYKEKLTYWTRGASWKSERDLEFENPCYSNTDLLEQRNMSVISEHMNQLNGISFLASMQNLALICAQQFISVFFNTLVFKAVKDLAEDAETSAFQDVIRGIMQFGLVDLNVIKVNQLGVCLVVDEMDSGIFEYLLGKLLGLMNNEMKGQLIFTSHNLRVLEKLDAKNTVCSTVNPDNRYIRLTGIEKNNNKRDFYIRAITVGGQKEELYDEDDLIAMGYAFRKAGKGNIS